MKIAVTGLNNTDNPGPGVPVIRSLRESGKKIDKIIGLLYDALEPGIYMDNIADSSYMIPYPSAGSEALFERLAYIHEKEHIDYIIPNLDSELTSFIRLQPRLEKMGIKMYLPTIEQLNVRSKVNLFNFCTEQNIKVPKNILATSFNDLYTIPNHFQYPVVVKGVFYEAYIVHNIDDARNAFEKLKAKWGFPIIIQEYLKGTEYNVIGLGDGTGRTVSAVPMRKLYVTDKGKGWAGVTIDDPPLMEIAKKTIEATKWKSGLELEFLKKQDTSEYYLIEINPRIPAWVYLATAAGQNIPSAIIDLIDGKDVPAFPSYEVGKIFVRCSYDLISDMSIFEKLSTTAEL